MCGSRPRTGIRRSAATRSHPRPRTASSCSPSSGWRTVRCRRTSSRAPPGRQPRVPGPGRGFFVWKRRSVGRYFSSRAGRGRSVPVDRAPPPRGRERCAASSSLLRARPRRCSHRDELDRLAVSREVDVRFTLTREWPDGWSGYRGRIDGDLLAEVGWSADERPLVYVCGPTRLRRDSRVEPRRTRTTPAGSEPSGSAPPEVHRDDDRQQCIRYAPEAAAVAPGGVGADEGDPPPWCRSLARSAWRPLLPGTTGGTFRSTSTSVASPRDGSTQRTGRASRSTSISSIIGSSFARAVARRNRSPSSTTCPSLSSTNGCTRRSASLGRRRDSRDAVRHPDDDAVSAGLWTTPPTPAQSSASGGSSTGPTACSRPFQAGTAADEPRASLLALPRPRSDTLQRRALAGRTGALPSRPGGVLAQRRFVRLLGGRPERPRADVLRLCGPGACRSPPPGAPSRWGPSGSNEPADRSRSLPYEAVRTAPGSEEDAPRIPRERLPGGAVSAVGSARAHIDLVPSARRTPRPPGRLSVDALDGNAMAG